MALYQPTTPFDLLRVPGLGRLLRWRWGRLVVQLPLLALALLVVYDGLTGPQLASQNIATVSVWVHYRGLVMLALLLAGNLFCMGCPFTLPRTLAHRISGHGRRWPQKLRNKWLAIGVFVAYLWLYEAFDLWASPALTAWLVIGYFVAAFVLEALFAESPFCKYICPLGTFNFVASTVSPLQITARSADVCRTCVGKECVNGSAQTLGCGTELFVPQIKSNLDCTFCLDCARACPHDNVALAARKPLREFRPVSLRSYSTGAWPQRWDLAFLALVFAFAGLANAFGMTPPVYVLAATLSRALGTRSEPLLLALIFGLLMVLLPAALGLGAAWLSQRWGAGRGRRYGRDRLRLAFSRYAPTVTPLAFAIWFAHYWFHFSSGALAIVPVVQSFLLDHGVALPGVGFGTALLNQPDWSLGAIMSQDAVFLLVLAAVAVGFLASLYSLSRTAVAEGDTRVARRVMLPWLALWTALALAALLIFSLPMEMRGLIG